MTPINQANQFFSQGKIQQAQQLYRQLLQQNPNDINALWGLGKVGLALNSYPMARDIFAKCVQMAPQQPGLWLSLAEVYQKLTRFEQAEQAIKKAYQLKTDFVPSLLALAVFYSESGKYDEADVHLKKLQELHPQHIQAFCLQVRIKSLSQINQHAKQMLNLLGDNSLPDAQQILLHYAFFDLYHQNKDYQQAFEHLNQANQKQRAQIQFSVKDMQGYFNQLIASFDAKMLADTLLKSSERADSNPIPIFIVGQPRSGTTLLEQMLIGHSAISSGGELPFIGGDIAQGLHQITGKNYPEACRLLQPQHCKELAAHYLKSLQNLAPDARYIIDKMPANYQSIGLIKMLMPQAKVIHITRDPIDVSWSIYRNHFSSPEPYFCSLTEIGQYHHCYERVMAHWQNVCPQYIHTIAYQDLVSQPQREISKVLQFCGLNFEDLCLAFSQQQRHISTLSDVQLRQGIQTNTAGAWQPYRQHL
ncbi:MAG: sulfotransferase, partial [Psychrosphaera sp.]|nr:sulfotransferase [Psychrosphaera sp.]